jgi:hypothetical protein
MDLNDLQLEANKKNGEKMGFAIGVPKNQPEINGFIEEEKVQVKVGVDLPKDSNRKFWFVFIGINLLVFVGYIGLINAIVPSGGWGLGGIVLAYPIYFFLLIDVLIVLTHLIRMTRVGIIKNGYADFISGSLYLFVFGVSMSFIRTLVSFFSDFKYWQERELYVFFLLLLLYELIFIILSIYSIRQIKLNKNHQYLIIFLLTIPSLFFTTILGSRLGLGFVIGCLLTIFTGFVCYRAYKTNLKNNIVE